MPSLALVSRFAVAFSATLALAAVLGNFLLARSRNAPIRAEKRSPVATGTMLAFFGALYVVLRFRLGEIYAPKAAMVLGLVLLAAGTVGNILGRLALAGNWGDHVVMYRDHQLVASGIYRWVRHPLYASLIWMASGASLIFGNPWPWPWCWSSSCPP